jgi:hypothetical protein
MNPPLNLWDQLHAELRPRLAAVGFSPFDFPATPPTEPAGVIYTAFAAPYAVLFCVQIPSEDPQQITAATYFACDTMRTALTKAGANDWNRDGYVLAAIQAAPSSTETKQCLRSFEQSRSICRRHAIWPESQPTDSDVKPWTSRLDRVTALALPEYEAPVAPVEPPVPGPKFLEEIHSRLKSGASYKVVAEEAVLTAREREDFHAS